jgi:hypothetical protein
MTAYNGYISGKVLGLWPGMGLLQTWRTTEWPEGAADSRLEISLAPAGKGTRLTMVHSEVCLLARPGATPRAGARSGTGRVAPRAHPARPDVVGPPSPVRSSKSSGTGRVGDGAWLRRMGPRRQGPPASRVFRS